MTIFFFYFVILLRFIYICGLVDNVMFWIEIFVRLIVIFFGIVRFKNFYMGLKLCLDKVYGGNNIKWLGFVLYKIGLSVFVIVIN